MADLVNRAELERLGDAFVEQFVATARCWMESHEWLLREVDGLSEPVIARRMDEWRAETAEHLRSGPGI